MMTFCLIYSVFYVCTYATKILCKCDIIKDVDYNMVNITASLTSLALVTQGLASPHIHAYITVTFLPLMVNQICASTPLSHKSLYSDFGKNFISD